MSGRMQGEANVSKPPSQRAKRESAMMGMRARGRYIRFRGRLRVGSVERESGWRVRGHPACHRPCWHLSALQPCRDPNAACAESILNDRPETPPGRHSRHRKTVGPVFELRKVGFSFLEPHPQPTESDFQTGEPEPNVLTRIAPAPRWEYDRCGRRLPDHRGLRWSSAWPSPTAHEPPRDSGRRRPGTRSGCAG
jgi:hypothetical protein